MKTFPLNKLQKTPSKALANPTKIAAFKKLLFDGRILPVTNSVAKLDTKQTNSSMISEQYKLLFRLLKQKLNFELLFKLISPYILVFLFTLAWNSFVKKDHIKCFDVGSQSNKDNCSVFTRISLTFLVIFVVSGGHFLLGASMICKYAAKKRKKILIVINLLVFLLVNFLLINLNVLSNRKTPSLLFRIVSAMIINGFAFFILCRFMGIEKPYALMKNYLYFEILIWIMPLFTFLSSTFTYPLFTEHLSNEASLFLYSIFNYICDVIFSEIMITLILQDNNYIEVIDLMPGTFILTGYFDGIFFGNLFPQEISSVFFWINLFLYFGATLFEISGLKKKIFKIYYTRRNKKIKHERAITLIENGSRFFSLIPLFLTFVFIEINAPYIYGSCLYDYQKFGWMESTEDYNYQNISTIVSFKKFLIVFCFWVFILLTGFFNRKYYIFCQINFSTYIKSIVYTFKICTMFTVGFEYSFKMANVVNNSLVDEILDPFIGLLS